jgi:glutathione S-transferase
MRKLIGMHYSPWSQKARWALDHHGVAYEWVEHMPVLGEALLRLRARRWTGRVSAPLLLEDDGRVIADSWEIARHAEGIGGGAPLFPAEHLDEIARWNERGQAAGEAGRVLVTGNIAADSAALRAALPPCLPRAVRGAMAPVARLGVALLRRKYGASAETRAAAEEKLAAALDPLRDALADGRRYLCGGAFSYADVAMAVALQPVVPVAERFVPLAPATRRAWTNEGLAQRFADLLTWRDGIYERHRRPADAAGVGAGVDQTPDAPRAAPGAA